MKPMKKYLYILLAGAVLLAVACQEEKITYEIHDNITVVSQNLVFQPQGGSGEVVVEADSPVSASADRPWCNVTTNGMTITVTVPEWNGKESRYAKITIKSGQETIDLTAQQFGEVIGGLDMTDITSPAEGSVKEFKYVSNLPVSMTSSESWIHVVVDEELQVIKITVDQNTVPGTRTGVVNYSIGDHSGTFNVLQYPETILVQDGWTASIVDGGYEYPHQFDVIDIQATDPVEKFVWAVVDKSKVADVEDYAFSVVAVEKKNEIMAKVESGQLASFAEGLSSGSLSERIYDLYSEAGAYLIAVGYGDNGYVTGRWGYVEIPVTDREPPYYKWTGNWTITGRTVPYTGQTFAGSEVWTITKDESDVEYETLTVRGMNSITQTSIVENDAAALKLQYHEDGSIEFRAQAGKTFVYSADYGDCYIYPEGLYTKNGTSWSRVNGTYTIFTAKFSDDYKTITITPGIRSTGGVDYNYDAFRLYFFRISTSGYYSLNTSVSSGVIPLPFEMTRNTD